MRALSALLTDYRVALFLPALIHLDDVLPVVSQRHCRHTSIRTLMAAFAAVPIGVLNSRGAAISAATCTEPVAWFFTVCRDLAVTPTRRFRILAESNPILLFL